MNGRTRIATLIDEAPSEAAILGPKQLRKSLSRENALRVNLDRLERANSVETKLFPEPSSPMPKLLILPK